MPSIRRSLIGYFLLLMGITLGGVGLLVDRFVVNAIRAREVVEADEGLAGHLLRVAAQVAKAGGVAEKGWRASFNTNQEGGQVIWHLHLHVLGGRQMGWPPG